MKGYGAGYGLNRRRNPERTLFHSHSQILVRRAIPAEPPARGDSNDSFGGWVLRCSLFHCLTPATAAYRDAMPAGDSTKMVRYRSVVVSIRSTLNDAFAKMSRKASRVRYTACRFRARLRAPSPD